MIRLPEGLERRVHPTPGGLDLRDVKEEAALVLFQ
jgi:hypothetical protein